MNSKTGRYLAYSTPVQRKNSLKATGLLGRSVSGSETDVSTSNENLSHEERYVLAHTPRQDPQGQENHPQQADPYGTLIIRDDPWNQRIHDGVPPPMYKAPGKETLYDPSVREITDIPDDYLSQSQVLKHLAKEVKVTGIEGEMKSGKHKKALLSKLSKSQPDLSALSLADRENTLLRHTLGNTRKDQQRCAQMVDHLLQENSSLKSELESCYHRVAKAHKLEEEVCKVTRAHEELVAQCDRRERLENARISRLQAEVRRLQEANQRLVACSQPQTDHARAQIAKREALIAQLIQQNKELVAQKERQEIELAAQRATLQEQRTHIDILDTALINAQANVVRLEEECRQKQVQAERVVQLQRALSSLQLASDRREQSERKLRLQLEQELKSERAKHSTSKEIQGESGESLGELKRELRERDEKIMRLEGETAKWEQKYLEESQLRQAAIEAASIPKDAKIAALEKTSQETEKLIAEARSDRIRQMDEVHAAQKKISDLEAKVKEVECKLAEKDAMIRVLQNKHTLDKEVSNSYPSISLAHTPHPSLTTTDLNLNLASDQLGGVSTQSVFSSVSSCGLTSSTGFGSSAGGSIAGDSYHHKYSSPSQSYHHKSLDDQLKELDSQLLSKRGLCCFPGFSHPGSSSRKGKIPQPLLASVNSSSFIGGRGAEAHEMVLLEKQGLCSQAQRGGERCASLPPSSLPRPQRAKGKKVGDYGRLSDGKSNGGEDTDRKNRQGSPLVPRAYVRLSDESDQNKHSSSDSGVESTSKGSPTRCLVPPPRSYSRLNEQDSLRTSPVKAIVNNLSSRGYSRLDEPPSRNYTRLSDSDNEKPQTPPVPDKRDSPSRKVGEYSRLDKSDKPEWSLEKKDSKKESLLPIPTFSKIPTRSYLPPPRKFGDYSVFEQKNTEPKIGLLARRGSLQREQQPQATRSSPPIRSLPATNKYRIQF